MTNEGASPKPENSAESGESGHQLFPTLPERTRHWLRAALIVVLGILAFYTAYRLRAVFTPLLIAAALAYILNPLVTWFESKGASRLRVIILTYLLGGALVSALVVNGALLLYGSLTEQKETEKTASQSIDTAASNETGLAAVGKKEEPEKLSSQSEPTKGGWRESGIAKFLAKKIPIERREELLGKAKDFLQNRAGALLKQAWGVIESVFNSLAYYLAMAVLVPLYSFFILWRYEAVVKMIGDHLPHEYRDGIISIVKQIDQATASFFRGQLMLCLAVGVLMSIGLAIVGVRFALVLGLWIGVLNLVPLLSWIFGLPPALLACWFHGPDDSFWKLAVGTLIVFAVVQGVLESFILTPYIQGKSVGLHPVALVLTLVIASEAAGLFGMMIAIPAACALRIVYRDLILPEIRRYAKMESLSNG
jgi:predicted PurR-regulated permease PerM